MNKLKSSVPCFFYAHSHQFLQAEEDRSASTSPTSHRACLKSMANHLPDQLRGRCGYVKARIGRACSRSSVDFSYDLSSYALNFDDDSRTDDDLPLRYFAAKSAASSPTADFNSNKLR